MAARWRLAELGLLVFPLTFLALGITLIALVGGAPASRGAWGPLLLFGGVLLGVHAFLIWRCPHCDQMLLPLVAALCALGLVMIARLEPDLAMRQAIWVG